MATRYFWETDTDEKFLELVPENVPTSVLRPFRAREILSAPGLGDPRVNSLATMVLFTAFASELGEYLNLECPGFDWVETAVASEGDQDFERIPSSLLPSSAFDLCASLDEFEVELEVERGRRGAARAETAVAAEKFASAIDPDAPFEVVAFSHLVLTQVTLSWNRVTFDLYLDVAFSERERELFDAEVVSAYFDEACPATRDTRVWLTSPGVGGAIGRPEPGEGLPEGWETVPAEDVSTTFRGDLRTLPVGESTWLETLYPPFDYYGVRFTNLPTSWQTVSTDPPEAVLTLGWSYEAEELPFDLTQIMLVGPSDTRYPVDIERSQVAPGFVQFRFVLDVIPENLDRYALRVFPE